LENWYNASENGGISYLILFQGSTLEQDKALMITQSREETNSQFSPTSRISLFL